MTNWSWLPSIIPRASIFAIYLLFFGQWDGESECEVSDWALAFERWLLDLVQGLPAGQVGRIADACWRSMRSGQGFK